MKKPSGAQGFKLELLAAGGVLFGYATFLLIFWVISQLTEVFSSSTAMNLAMFATIGITLLFRVIIRHTKPPEFDLALWKYPTYGALLGLYCAVARLTFSSKPLWFFLLAIAAVWLFIDIRRNANDDDDVFVRTALQFFLMQLIFILPFLRPV